MVKKIACKIVWKQLEKKPGHVMNSLTAGHRETADSMFYESMRYRVHNTLCGDIAANNAIEQLEEAV